MLDPSQLSHMRDTQVLSLMDTFHKLSYSRTFNEYNEPIEVYTEVLIDVTCGLEQKQGEERGADKNTVITWDAVLRLPISYVIDEKDRIRITKRYGERLDTPIDYQIVSPQQRGPSGIRLLLKKVAI